MAMVRPSLVTTLLAGLALRAAVAGDLTLSVVDAAGAPVADAVVYLEGGPAPAGTTVPAAPATIDQHDKAFVPQVTVVRTGAEVTFTNSDIVSHHVYSFARPNAFELPLYKGGTRPTVRLAHAGIVTLGCNIHDAMVGYIVVVDTPWFARADGKGVATLASVAPGEYRVQAWSPRLDAARALEGPVVAVPATPLARTVALPGRLRAADRQGGVSRGDY